MAMMPHVRRKFICYYEDQEQSSPYNRAEVLEIIGLADRTDGSAVENSEPYFRLSDGVTVVRRRGNDQFVVEDSGRFLHTVD